KNATKRRRISAADNARILGSRLAWAVTLGSWYRLGGLPRDRHGRARDARKRRHRVDPAITAPTMRPIVRPRTKRPGSGASGVPSAPRRPPSPGTRPRLIEGGAVRVRGGPRG